MNSQINYSELLKTYDMKNEAHSKKYSQTISNEKAYRLSCKELDSLYKELKAAAFMKGITLPISF
jgi:hypothetical protein